MNKLTAKTTIQCNTCGCKIKRTTTILVEAQDKESAIAEAGKKAKEWQENLQNENCKTCKSILKSI